MSFAGAFAPGGPHAGLCHAFLVADYKSSVSWWIFALFIFSSQENLFQSSGGCFGFAQHQAVK